MAIKKNVAEKPEEKPAEEAPKKAKITKKAAAPAPAEPAEATETLAPEAAEAAPKVTRKDLAKTIRDKVFATGKAVPIQIAEIMVVAYEEAIAEALMEGKEVILPGFGKWVAQSKEARERRNPATGETVMVAAHRSPKFKVGGKLKKSVNAGAEVADEDEDSAGDDAAE